MAAGNRRQTLEFRTVLDASADDVFRWHWEPGTLKKLIPPWEQVEVAKPAPGPVEGATAILTIRSGPAKIKWTARHGEIVHGRQFVDVQESGPFAFWRHLHKFEPITADKCELIDRIEYELPMSALSQPLIGWFVEAKVRRMFKYRHETTAVAMKSWAQSHTGEDR